MRSHRAVANGRPGHGVRYIIKHRNSMPFRVAFDLDGTIADMQLALQQQAKRIFASKSRKQADSNALPDPESEGSEASKVMEEMHLTPRQQRRLWAHVKTIPNFWEGLPETDPGIVARIAETALARRWEVIFLTTRPAVAGDTTQIQSQRWLVTQGFTLPSVFVVRHSRGKIADALELDAVVDDRPENCLDVAVDSKARSVLVWHGDLDAPPPGLQRLGVRVVDTITAALAFLIDLDNVKNDTSVVGSIKKLFAGDQPVRR